MQYSAIKPESPWKPDRRLEEMEYFQSCYPESMKQLQTYVSAECDKMDYPNSPIYDEYPDRTMICQVCQKICCSIPDEIGGCLRQAAMPRAMEQERPGTEVEEVEVYEVMQRRPPQGPPPWGPPPRPPQGPPGSNWLDDVVRLLFLNELQNRRCRNGRCR